MPGGKGTCRGNHKAIKNILLSTYVCYQVPEGSNGHDCPRPSLNQPMHSPGPPRAVSIGSIAVQIFIFPEMPQHYQGEDA